jgi:hypothetical protein
MKSRDSPVGIALGYGLDDRGSRVRFPARAGNFSLHHRIQNGSGAHPASCPTLLFTVLYGCETWPLMPREDHRLRMSQSKLLRRIFGRKRDDVTKKLRRLRNEELCKFYYIVVVVE